MDASETTSKDVIYQTLSDIFGFKTFRPNQEEIVRAILDGRDVFAIMPTGGGKSLCYQLPAILRPGLCVVVSPLLSLMKDQVDAAQKNGIDAATINSTTSTTEWREIVGAIERRRLDLLYVSPERVNTPKFQELLQNVELGFFAIDEAHCISQWGHNFRSDYLELGQLAERYPHCPIAAFTATATERVGQDIKESLKLRDPFCVKASFDRPNLFYQIVYKEDLHQQLLAFLKEMTGESGIVYRSTRKNVETTTAFLVANGFKAEAYHAGMSDTERARVQERFANDETPIVVATVAFGMGIDKSNVRFVAHGDLPHDIESYYQETGRAGRDGAPARCWLAYGYQDIAIQRSFLDDYKDPVAKASAAARLDAIRRFVDADGCRRVNLLKYFGETYKPSKIVESEESLPNFCGACDYCVGESKRLDVTIDAQKALSAMQRTGNRFGAPHLADVLVGALTEKVERFRHNELPTFGVGADRPKRYWIYLIQTLVTQEIATLAPDFDFPIPQVSPKGWEVMRGQRTVQMLERPMGKKKKTEKKRVYSRTDDPWDKNNLDPKSRRLFDVLRAKRMEVAKEENVPPYVVFSDKSLVEMAALKPIVDGDFLLVSGVGVRKLDSYGFEFMEVIREFLDNEG